MPLLPPRPLRLRRSFVLGTGLGALVALGAAIAVLVAGGSFLRTSARQITRDREVWERGVAAMDAEVNGESRTSRLLFHDYQLDVRFHDANGTLRTGHVAFETALGSIDADADPEVHYDAAAPERLALSWAVVASPSRWRFVLLAGAGLAVLVGSLGLFGAGLARRLFDARRCAKASEEARLKIVRVTQQKLKGRVTGAFVYRFRLPGPPKRDAEVVFNARKGAPLFADPDGKTLLALVPPNAPTRPLVLRKDLWPLDFSADEARAIRERAQDRNRIATPRPA